MKTYLTPSCHELYRAPRGGIRQISNLGIPTVSRANARIDYLHDNNRIGESQALEVLNTARLTVSETIQLN